MERVIRYTINENMEVSPTTVQDAGVQGEHNAAAVCFSLPEALQSGYSLYIEAVTSQGAYDRTPELTVEDGEVRQSLPSTWTSAGGTLLLRLSAVQLDEDGQATQIVYTYEARVRLRDRDDPSACLEAGKATLLEQQLLDAIEAGKSAVEAADMAAASAEEADMAAAQAYDRMMRTMEAAVSAGTSAEAAVQAKAAAEEHAENAAASAASAGEAAEVAGSALSSIVGYRGEIEQKAQNAAASAAAASTSAASAAGSAAASEESAAAAAGFASSASGYKVTAEFKAAEAAASAVTAGQAAASAETAVADERKRTAQLYANALQGKCSGQVIRADDISPVTHDMSVAVQNKNWIPFPYVDGAAGTTTTKNGVTFTVGADGSVTVNGTATGGNATFRLANYDIGSYLSDGEHPLRVHLSGCPAGGSASTYYLTQPNYGIKDVGSGVTYTTGQYNLGYAIVVENGVTANNLIFWPQLDIGEVATPYTRYLDDLTTVSVHRIRNNWIPYPYWFSGTTTLNGLTFTDQDGVIFPASTATVDTDFPVVEGLTLYAGTYTLSGVSGGYTDDWSLVCIDDTDGTIYAENKEKYGQSATFTLTRKTQVNVVIYVKQGVYMEGRYFMPMIEWGSSKSDYAPYSDAADYYPDSDGNVNVESLYPTTTLYAEDGIVLNCRYNRDANKAFEKLEQAIASLGG